MIGVGAAIAIALVWCGLVLAAVVVCAAIERRSRLAGPIARGAWSPPRSKWGPDPRYPPAASLLLRSLAEMARQVRSRTVVPDQSAMLRSVGRCIAWLALASALSLVPFAGPWEGGAIPIPLVVVDLPSGLLALVFLVLLMGLAQVAIGLADRSLWSRLGSVRMASRNLGTLALLILVLAPLSIESQSLRIHDVVSAQQTTFAPFSWLPFAPGSAFEVLRSWRWPAWNCFMQPVSALLFLPVLAGLSHRPLAWDPEAGSLRPSGFGLDGDPVGLAWGLLEARLARVLAAALFVALFLGSGALPFVSGFEIVDRLEPFIGRTLPALIVAGLETTVFFGKWILLLVLGAAIRRATARMREDRWTRIVVTRLLPIAWANVLLVSAIRLLDGALPGGA
ncbi:MAG TPA: hypothetical protein ENI85_08135 [Deltaproteobacteria bacterium]|nr:hypothetical protein [Deltaproteobacteria bacterium]